MHRVAACALLGLLTAAGLGAQSFINWESPHVHPLDLTPDGQRLLAVNTADARLEVYATTSGLPRHLGSVPVGLDPVTVRARTNDEAWVVNHVSDTVSVVRLDPLRVVATLATRDEPADVVFAGTPQRAFVSCSQDNSVLVFNPANLTTKPVRIPIDGEDPRALATSPDGSQVYAAIFESGNRTTILGGGIASTLTIDFPPNVVNDPLGPYGGLNPPPNDGVLFTPPIRSDYLPNGSNPAPRVGMIVRQDSLGRWRDDNDGDWTALVSGPQAQRSGRPPGWHLADHDVAVIDVLSFDVTYLRGLMNLVMGLAVHPQSGEITAVGTEATNEVRFEPQLKGRFLRVQLARIGPSGGTPAIVDLNDHLDYSEAQVAAQSDPDTTDAGLTARSLGDPRGIVWSPTGDRAYVSGMGSNNLVVVGPTGARLPLPAAARLQAGSSAAALGSDTTIAVGEGPTGLALDASRERLYVLNRFAASVSVVDTTSEQEIARVPFHDATPALVKAGRRVLYDTHATSGLGHVSCGSCHVDARTDRLAWDLGNPAGDLIDVNAQMHNLGMNLPGLNVGFRDFHPMKGPMSTQTLQAIIGMEPFHWRGDRQGIEEFNPAFVDLLGDDRQLTAEEMQQFEDFLASIHFPPNPFRNPDNTLPTSLPLTGHFSDGRFAASGGLPAGAPLPPGNAQQGLAIFRPPRRLDAGNFACATCHTLPTGAGGDVTRVGLSLQPIPPGADGQHHLALVSNDGSTNTTMKVPQLRGLYEKVGFDFTRASNRAGFGLLHDGSIDSISRFVSEVIFQVQNDQEIANLVAFMLAFSGSGLPAGSPDVFDGEPPGPPSQDTHAAVGRQITVAPGIRNAPAVVEFLTLMTELADDGVVGLVAHGRRGSLARGFAYTGDGLLQSDRTSESVTVDALRLGVMHGAEVTFTVVPAGSETRFAVDRDGDGFFDRDELDVCSDPADPASTPQPNGCVVFADDFESGNLSAWSATGG